MRCLTTPSTTFDIAIIGAPFDTAVSYRTGARFGPRALRAASARQLPPLTYNVRAGIDPYTSGLKVLDCGDIPVTAFDNVLALRQMTEAYTQLGSYATARAGTTRPRLITLGGDHSIALPALRALQKIYGRPVTVLHFDAHLDTWDPSRYSSAWVDKSKFKDPQHPTLEEWPAQFTHGSMFWIASKEGLISPANATKASGQPPNVHAGLRTRLSGLTDNEADDSQGWRRIASDEIEPDLLGPIGLARKILDIIGTEAPVYLSVDIDVIDPGLAPGTGTPEPGGWTTRELIRVLRELGPKGQEKGLNIVGADLVEVSPSHDGAGEQTALAGAQVVYEIVTSLVGRTLVEEGALVEVPSGKVSVKDEL